MNSDQHNAANDSFAIDWSPPEKAGGVSWGGLTDIIDLKAVWAAIFRLRYTITGITGGAVALGVLITFLTTPVFRAEATIQINQEAAKVIGTEESDISASIQDSDRFLQTQLDVIRSGTLATMVADDLDLFENPAFFERMALSPEAPASTILDPEQVQRNRVIALLREEMGVTLPLKSRLATIRFDSPDPELAAEIANSFADNFIELNLQTKVEASAYARRFLGEQLEEAAAKLAESERNALEYARKTRIIDASNAATGDGSAQSPRSLVTATLVQLNAEYSRALASRIQAEQKWQQARDEDLMSLPEVLSNLAIQRLLEERAKISAEYQQELERRRDEFPTVRQLKSRIDELEAQVNTIATSIRSTLRSDYESALQREQALEQRIAQLKSETLDEQSQSVQLGILQRQTSNNRELFDLLLTRYNELNAEAGVQANNVSIVDRAETPEKPESPNVLFNLALSLMTGLSLSALAVFLIEQFLSKVRTVDDINRKVGLTALGAIPRVGQDVDLIEEIVDQKSDISEAFAGVRSSLLLSTATGLPKNIMLTSAQQSEGKTSSSLAIALSLARIGKNVLLVDLDLRRPRIHKLVGVENDQGMADLLAHNVEIADVAKPTEYERVDVITSGGIPPNPAELLAGGNLKALLGRLEAQYDVVIIDAPPLLALADAVEISAVASAMIFIVESGRSHASALRASVQRLESVGAIVTGALLTKFDAKQSGYAYDYAYRYKYATNT